MLLFAIWATCSGCSRVQYAEPFTYWRDAEPKPTAEVTAPIPLPPSARPVETDIDGDGAPDVTYSLTEAYKLRERLIALNANSELAHRLYEARMEEALARAELVEKGRATEDALNLVQRRLDETQHELSRTRFWGDVRGLITNIGFILLKVL